MLRKPLTRGFGWTCLLAAFGLACSGSPSHEGDDPGVTPDVPQDVSIEAMDVVIPVDRGPEDVGATGDDGIEEEAVADALPDEGADGEVIEPGTPGAPCEQDSDCNTNYCIETPDGMRCAAPCVDTCPGRSQCVQVQPAPDPLFICVYAEARLCRPCYHDIECVVEYAPGVAGCIASDAGGYCGTPCEKDEDCAGGYGCVLATSTDGVVAKQCRLPEGECQCTDRWVRQDLSTYCITSNENGSCRGLRTCTEAGPLDECTARIPAAESCNRIDDDCNGTTDDVAALPCMNSNAFGSCPGTTGCQNGQDACLGTPASPEICNGIDDNCAGGTDEEGAQGCRNYYRDEDLDNYGVTTDSKCLCGPTAPYRTTLPGDCSDTDPDANPLQAEACNGKDDNCKDGIDEAGASGCETYYRDGDGDDYGLSTDSRCLCLPAEPYSASLGGDCNDLDRDVHPNTAEVCNGKDDNCDRLTDPENSPGCTQFYYDGDGDGYGTRLKAGKCLCAPDYATKYTSQTNTDCRDDDVQINPGKLEVCGDGIDNNCNDAIDENGAQGCQNHWMDLDGDTYGGGTPVCSCAKEAPYTADVGGDCADQDASRNPGVKEKCGDAIDNDCDTLTDEEGGTGCQDRWFDGDKDGYGDGDPKCLCAPSGWYTAPAAGDCDDLDPLLNPGATEECDGLDNDCDTQTDEEGALGCSTWFLDSDRDGYGARGSGRCMCAKTGLYDSANGLDCADGDATINPGAREVCDPLNVDENCNDLANEEGALTCKDHYYDGDRDGYGSDSRDPRCLCAADGKYDTLVGGDCDDTTTAIKPNQVEICEPAGVTPRDDNCNGLLNEENAIACGLYYYDYDRDGHGTPDKAARCYCTGGNTALRYDSPYNDDCNDFQNTISGGLPELCQDGFDNDCDGFTDEENASGCSRFYKDVDGDGYGLTNDFKCLCAADASGAYTAPDPEDCDDTNNAIHPGGTWCSKDGDCDGSPLDAGEECDDGNLVNWDGCSSCRISEFQVGTTTANDQWYPSVAALNGGGYVVAFRTTRLLTGEDVALRLVNADGTPVGTSEITANTTTSNDQQSPSAAPLADGGFVVTWESAGQDMGGWGVYGQRFTATGTKNGGEFLVNATTSSDQRVSSVGSFADGRVVVAWQSFLQDGNDWGVFARRVRTDGLGDGAEIPVNVTTLGGQDLPALAALSDGRFIVAWRGLVDRGGGVTDTDVFMRRFKADGTADGTEVVVSQTTANDQSYPSISLAGSDSYVIAWQSAAQDGSGTGIYARRFALDGTPLAGEFRVNTYSAADQGDPTVSGTADGRFVIAWRSDLQDLDAGGVFVQRYLSGGAASKAEFRANTYTANEQAQPSIAAGANGFLVGWASNNQDGAGFGAFARRFDW